MTQGGAIGGVAKMVIAKVPIKAGTMVTCFGETAAVWEHQGGRELDEMIRRQLKEDDERFSIHIEVPLRRGPTKGLLCTAAGCPACTSSWGISSTRKNDESHGTRWGGAPHQLLML